MFKITLKIIPPSNLINFQNLRWRKQNRMDTIHDEDWEEFNKEYPYHVDSVDLEFQPGTVG